MSKTHPIDVGLINAMVAIVMECNWIAILVCNDSSIHMTVAQAMNRETSSRTGIVATACPITHPSWV